MLKDILGKLQKLAVKPDKVFALALLTAGFCTASYVLFLSDIYRDTAHVYAVYVREFGRGNIWGGIGSEIPMFNILLAGLLNICKLEAVKALSLVAGIFYLLGCFPLRRLLERYVSPLAAAWGCVLYVAAPKLIRFGCAPLLESTRMFFLLAGVLYFLRMAEEPKFKNALLFGLSVGFLSVTRVEGFFVTLALLCGMPLFLLLFRRPAAWKKSLAALAVAVVAAFAAVTPFCAVNYHKSGYFATDNRLVWGIEYTLYLVGITEPKESKVLPSSATAEAQGGGVYSDNPALRPWSEKLSHSFSSFIRGGYELYWIFALIGGWLIVRRRMWRDDYWVLIGVTFLQSAIYVVTISAYRYYLYMIPLFMMFTLTGVDFIRQLAVKYVPKKLQFILPLICVVLFIAQIANGVSRAYSSKGKDFQAVGRWVEEYRQKNFPQRELKIFAPTLTEIAYWSGADHTEGYEKRRHDPQTFKDFDLAVVHRKRTLGLEKRSDLERIPNTPHAKNIWVFRVKAQENK